MMKHEKVTEEQRQCMNHVFSRLLGPEFRERVAAAEEPITLEGFISITWPVLSKKEFLLILTWMRKAKAQDMILDIFKYVAEGTNPNLTPTDVKWLFETIDVNKD